MAERGVGRIDDVSQSLRGNWCENVSTNFTIFISSVDAGIIANQSHVSNGCEQ
jgi:hypothetical protein